MPSLATLPLFVAASVVLLLIPGPAVLFIVARSGAQGTRAGLVSVLGVHSASVVHVLAAVAGLSAVVVASSIAFTDVKIIGGMYLIYLGVKALHSARRATAAATPTVRPEKRLFAEAFVISLLNPKVAIFFLAFLPQFVERGHGAIWSQTLILGVIYIMLGLCSDSMYAADRRTYRHPVRHPVWQTRSASAGHALRRRRHPCRPRGPHAGAPPSQSDSLASLEPRRSQVAQRPRSDKVQASTPKRSCRRVNNPG
ncbi:MAG: LysE family translocator [Ilumatobacteraceae bacterium]